MRAYETCTSRCTKCRACACQEICNPHYPDSHRPALPRRFSCHQDRDAAPKPIECASQHARRHVVRPPCVLVSAGCQAARSGPYDLLALANAAVASDCVACVAGCGEDPAFTERHCRLKNCEESRLVGTAWRVAPARGPNTQALDGRSRIQVGCVRFATSPSKEIREPWRLHRRRGRSVQVAERLAASATSPRGFYWHEMPTAAASTCSVCGAG